MEPSKPAGGSKPSKVELTKLASEYLKTFVADEVGNGSSHFSEDAATVLKFHGSTSRTTATSGRSTRRKARRRRTSSWCGCGSSGGS